MPSLLPWVAVGALVARVAGLFVFRSKRRPGHRVSYQSMGWLFTPSERDLLAVLDQAVGAEHRIFGKVRLADVATVARQGDMRVRWNAVKRLAVRHFDYVVCRTDNLSLVCAVELCDRPRRRKASALNVRNEVCRAIGLPLLMVTPRPRYSVPELRAQFRSLTGAVGT